MDNEHTQSYSTEDIDFAGLLSSESGTQLYDTDREEEESEVLSGRSSPVVEGTLPACPSMPYPLATLLNFDVLAQYLLMLEIPV